MRNFLLMVCILPLHCAGLLAQSHLDVMPYIVGGTGSGTGITGGKITTGGTNDLALNHPSLPGYDPLQPTVPALGINVFGYDFGENINDPYFIGDPGFNNGPTVSSLAGAPNSGLLPNGILNFSAVTNLRYWDGNGAINFVPAPALVELAFVRGSGTRFISGASYDPLPLSLGTISSGRIHQHAESYLLYNGSADHLDLLGNAPDGIYAFAGILSLAANSTVSSDPIYFVYNNGLTEAQHDAAITAIQAVPEPGTWALLGCSLVGGLVVGRRWRQRRLLAVG